MIYIFYCVYVYIIYVQSLELYPSRLAMYYIMSYSSGDLLRTDWAGHGF